MERRTETWRTNKNMTDEHHQHNGVMEPVNEACADHWVHNILRYLTQIRSHCISEEAAFLEQCGHVQIISYTV